jgi:APA family basic amino acid/polyamine antiporter
MNLEKKLGFLDVFCIASGAMISSGLFVLPGVAHAYAGPAVVFSYLFAGLLVTSGMLSVAEIITAMPKAGGDYFFITRTMGPAAGTVAGLLSWFSLTLKSSFALVGMSAFLYVVVDWEPHITAIIICMVFIAINIIGTKESGRLQVVLVVILLALMLLYIFRGVAHIDSRHFIPFAPFGWHSVFATAGIVFISYGGLLKIASIAEEIKDPGKVIPFSMISALIVISIFYTLMVFVTTGVLSSEDLDGSRTPISLGAMAFMGRSGMIIMSVAAVLAFVSTANAGIMTASRYLLSLSRDKLISPLFGIVNARFQTPHIAVVTTGLCVIGALFLDLEILVKAASTVLILTYILANLCLIILRESRLLNYQPKFRAPLYPYLPVAGILGYIVLLLEMGVGALVMSGGLIAGGLFFYWFYGRIRAEREYAILHLIERISNRALTGGLLESELKDIIRNRDDLCFDRFDEIVEKAIVVDYTESSNTEELFSFISELIEEHYNFNADAVQRALMDRERAGSTNLLPGYAISDIIVDTENFFSMILIRCSEGILLREGESPVHALFVLVTSRDERDFYLQAVASISQIIQMRSFDKRWSEARTEQQLRDLILLGERRRVCQL